MKLLYLAIFQISFVSIFVGGLLFFANPSKVIVSSEPQRTTVVYCDENGNCNLSINAGNK